MIFSLCQSRRQKNRQYNRRGFSVQLRQSLNQRRRQTPIHGGMNRQNRYLRHLDRLIIRTVLCQNVRAGGRFFTRMQCHCRKKDTTYRQHRLKSRRSGAEASGAGKILKKIDGGSPLMLLHLPQKDGLLLLCVLIALYVNKADPKLMLGILYLLL